LTADFNGGIWAGTDHGIYFVTIAGKMTDPLPAWTHQHQILTLFRDRDDCIWAGTNHGLIRINPAGQAVWNGSKTAFSHPTRPRRAFRPLPSGQSSLTAMEASGLRRSPCPNL